MNVYIPSPLRSYTKQQALIEAVGSTLAELLENIDRKYPGFRFRIINEQDRIREHIKLFVNQKQTDSLAVELGSADQVHIICALSGG